MTELHGTHPSHMPRPEMLEAFTVEGADGVARRAYLLLPPDLSRPVPVVLSPHPFGFTALSNLFGEPAGPRTLVDVPGLRDTVREAGVAVLTLDAIGARMRWASLAWAAHLDAYLTALDHAVSLGLPLDDRRVVACGLSMGGMEALMLGAAHPHRVRAVVAQNAVTDLAAWHAAQTAMRDDDVRTTIEREVGGTPASAPSAYARRSPIDQAEALRSVPVQLRFNDRDQIVSSNDQSRRLLARLQALGGRVEGVIDLPTALDPADPGRHAHEHVDWPAAVDWALDATG